MQIPCGPDDDDNIGMFIPASFLSLKAQVTSLADLVEAKHTNTDAAIYYMQKIG